MDEMDKLSCKEELDLSDLEHSTNDDHKDADDKPKKRKRRRREIDLIKLSDDDDSDEDGSTRKSRRFSPGPHSPASHREPRTCVLKASQKRRPLSRLLEQLLRNLEKKDPHQFFAWPVNDNFAPNYSNIIRRPMDFSTIKQKIDDNEYRSLNCFINDFKLMCNNAMKYNKPGTVYHKAAKRLLHAGLRQLAPQKLRPLGGILTYMYEIPLRELGFDIGAMDMHKLLKRSSPIKSGGSDGEGETEAAGEGGDGEEASAGREGGVSHMERARELHRRRLAKKAFPRMDAEGKTTLCLVTGAEVDDQTMTLGQYIGKLTQGTGSLHSLREDRRNLVKGVKPLNYGPFSSAAPAHDGTFATLTKEESHLLYHTLPSETGQGNEELLRFDPDSPWNLFYDMEALFPAGGGRVAGTPSEDTSDEQDISQMKVDINELRTLSELGIDVDFLTEIEEEVAASQKDYGIAAALKHTGELLRKLEKEQLERLSRPPPAHLALAAGPGGAERAAARRASGLLRGMAARVPPAHVVSLPAVRAALGVTLAHLDTPLSTECVEEPALTEPYLQTI